MIPKIVYQTWYSKECIPSIYREIMKANQKMNPEYRFVLMDDMDLDAYFDTNVNDKEVRKAYHRINPRYGAARADLFRYVILFQQGGIYLDIKVQCLVPFREWIRVEEDCGLLSYWDGLFYHRDKLNNQEGELQNWNLVFAAHHPALQKVIRACCQTILKMTVREASSQAMTGKQAVLEVTGPIMLTRYAEAYMMPKTATPLSKSREIIIRRFSSRSYLYYGDSFHGLTWKEGLEGYTHYASLREPFLLQPRFNIPIVYQSPPVCSRTKPGVYRLFQGKMHELQSIVSLLRGCDIVFAIHRGVLCFLAVGVNVPLKMIPLPSMCQNEERVYYDESWCIKQAYINDKGFLRFHHCNYFRFYDE